MEARTNRAVSKNMNPMEGVERAVSRGDATVVCGLCSGTQSIQLGRTPPRGMRCVKKSHRGFVPLYTIYLFFETG